MRRRCRNKHLTQYADSGQIRMPASRLQRFLFVAFKRLYPYLNLTWELYILSHDIAYMFGRTRWWRPWHRWLGIITVRRGEELVRRGVDREIKHR